MIWWLVACRPAPVAFPARTVDYDEVVLTASAGSSLESTVRYRIEPGRSDVWVVATLRTEGVVYDEGAPVMHYDSDTPKGADAWPLVLQHAIAARPAAVRVDTRGRPVALDDPATWADDALAALAQAPVPPAALGNDRLVDPDGYIANLARTFPGHPPRGDWVRDERLAGLRARRTEICQPIGRVEGLPAVRCEGSCTADDDPRGTLYGATCWTEVRTDREGIVTIESGYSGTLIRTGSDGQAEDLPVAGQRLVRRVGS